MPTPATATAKFPFPQNRTGSHCTFPTSKLSDMNAKVSFAYSSWKAAMVTTTGAPAGTARVQDPTTMNRTVSEGIGYGMLITVYMNDKTTFDQLWGYAKAHLSNGLMSWIIDSSGNVAGNGGQNSATDADEDIAWSLLMAEKQWGGYASAASAYLSSMSGDKNGNTLTDGNFGGAGNSHPDYASPAYYAGFGWSGVASGEYGFLNSQQNKTTGLIPDSTGNGQFGYDACRAPWRVGLDYCWNGAPAAQQFLTPMVAFFSKLGASGEMLPIPVGGGTGTFPAAAIAGPIGVAAMISASNQAFIDATWAETYKLTLPANNSNNYFDSSVGLIGLLTMSGNFFDYSNPPM